MNVTIFNENIGETLTQADRQDYRQEILAVHPDGIHNTLKQLVEEMDGVTVRTATLQNLETALTEEILADTDVLLWWGHMAHDQVPDALADQIHKRVLDGMGLMLLHSSHCSKVTQRLLGTTGDLRWRHDSYERVFCVAPSHPICQGVPEHFELGMEECYAECFDIPKPDDVLFISWFDIGEVFRSGCTWTRGNGKIFYFQPGHETNHSYQHEMVRKIIKNGVQWLAPTQPRIRFGCPHIDVTLEEQRKQK